MRAIPRAGRSARNSGARADSGYRSRVIPTGPTRDGPLPWFDRLAPAPGVSWRFMEEHVSRARANLARDAFDDAFADLEAADAALADLQAADHG